MAPFACQDESSVVPFICGIHVRPSLQAVHNLIEIPVSGILNQCRSFGCKETHTTLVVSFCCVCAPNMVSKKCPNGGTMTMREMDAMERICNVLFSSCHRVQQHSLLLKPFCSRRYISDIKDFTNSQNRDISTWVHVRSNVS